MVGTQKFKVPVEATGDYAKFQSVTLGTIEVAAPGRMNLKLMPGADWKAINLRALKIQVAP